MLQTLVSLQLFCICNPMPARRESTIFGCVGTKQVLFSLSSINLISQQCLHKLVCPHIVYTGDCELLLPKNLPVDCFIFFRDETYNREYLRLCLLLLVAKGCRKISVSSYKWSGYFLCTNRVDAQLRLRPFLFEIQMNNEGLLLITVRIKVPF